MEFAVVLAAVRAASNHQSLFNARVHLDTDLGSG